MIKALEKIWFYAAYLTLIIIPFHSDILRSTLIIVPAVSLIVFFCNRRLYFNRILLLPILYVLIEFIWIFFNIQNITDRMARMDSQLALLFIPLSFMVIEPGRIGEKYDSFMYSFIIGNLLTSLYALGYSVYNVLNDHLSLSVYRIDLFFSELHHHTYFSLNALIALLFIIKLVFRDRHNYKVWLFLTPAWFAINIAIYVATSRIGLFLALILNLLFVWKLIKSFSLRWLQYLSIVVFLILFVFSLSYNNNLDFLRNSDRNIFSRIWNKNNRNTRTIIWKEALKGGWENFPVGHGSFTFKTIMSERLSQYIANGSVAFKDPDAHNQYLEAFFETGLAGITLLFLLLFIPFRLALKRKQPLFAVFLMVFMVVFLFESLLKRRWGVESFIFLYSLLAIQLKNQPDSPGKKKLIRMTTVPVTMNVILQGQLKYLSRNYEVIGVTSPGEEIREIMEREGIRVYPILMKRPVHLLFDSLALIKAWAFFAREEPDIVHTQTPKAGLIGILAARLAGVPVRIHTIAGLPVMEQKGFKRKVVALADKLVYRNATRVLSNSAGLKDYLAENNYIPEAKIEVLGHGSTNGIDLAYFSESKAIIDQGNEIKAGFYGNNSTVSFLYIGRIVKDKGINELIEAFARLNEANPETKLILVGKQEEGNQLAEETLACIRKNKSIILTDYRKDVRPYLSLADIFVFPSYREGFPNVILQALSFNKPCIASDINGINEVISHMKNGFLVPVKNADALFEAMRLLSKDQGLRLKLTTDNRPMLRQKFSREIVWLEYERFYKSL
jgi:glycosyltransferase involved in cell wall biosynthesis/O-antigen ligase